MTGAPFQQSWIAVFRVPGGQIMCRRNYLHPLIVIEASIQTPTRQTAAETEATGPDDAR